MTNKPVSWTTRLPRTALGWAPRSWNLALAAAAQVLGSARLTWRQGHSSRNGAGSGAIDQGPTATATSLGGRSSDSGDVDVLDKLVRESSAARQHKLLAEALELLEQSDRRVIEQRLSGTSYESIARELRIPPDAAGARYALAIQRLGERLAWVDEVEGRGVALPERAVLGQFRFFERSTQEIALRLGLLEDVVEHWIRLSDRDPTPGPGARR